MVFSVGWAMPTKNVRRFDRYRGTKSTRIWWALPTLLIRVSKLGRSKYRLAQRRPSGVARRAGGRDRFRHRILAHKRQRSLDIGLGRQPRYGQLIRQRYAASFIE